MDWERLQAELAAATIAAADGFLGLPVEEQPYAISLITSEDAMSVGMAANTESALAACLAVEPAGETPTPQDLAWFRWGTGEWQHEMWRDPLFADLNRVLTAAAISEASDPFDTHFGRLIETMTQALAALRRARPAALAQVTLFVTVTDSDESEAIENASAARLNPPGLGRAFLNRFGPPE